MMFQTAPDRPGQNKKKKGKTKMEKNLEITVMESEFHGGEIIYRGSSLNQAIRIARKACGSRWDSDCGCGGARIEVIEEGRKYQLLDWEATPAFHPANEIKWVLID